jgi:hypothetical protein
LARKRTGTKQSGIDALQSVRDQPGNNNLQVDPWSPPWLQPTKPPPGSLPIRMPYNRP